MTVAKRLNTSFNLDEDQRKAVEAEGAVAVLAGPGSGKTQVIASRILRLIEEHNVPPQRICALTFTNKAAREMKERVQRLAKQDRGKASTADGVLVCTLHSLSAKILRTDGRIIGVDPKFTICDSSEQKKLVQTLLKEGTGAQGDEPHGPDETVSIEEVLEAIAKAKNQLLTREEWYQKSSKTASDKTTFKVWAEYEVSLKKSNCLDFTDLLVLTKRLLERADVVRMKYSQRFQHVLVDEFQDLSVLQYLLASLLSSYHRALTVVGDPDQCIYSWRYAAKEIWQMFKRDFPNAKMIPLEKNYRSSPSIVHCALKVISESKGRIKKGMWTHNPEGPPVIIQEVQSPESEARYATSHIQRSLSDSSSQSSAIKTIGILLRSSSMAKTFEHGLLSAGVKYTVVGGAGILDRKEVKTLLCYLRLALNRSDDLALSQVINTPRRGLGEKTQEEIRSKARENGISQHEACVRAVQGRLTLRGVKGGHNRLQQLQQFLEVLDEVEKRICSGAPLIGSIEYLMGAIQFEEFVRGSSPLSPTQTDDMETCKAWESIEALLQLVRSFTSETDDGHAKLSCLLEALALGAVADDETPTSSKKAQGAAEEEPLSLSLSPSLALPVKVDISTIHAAKGREWDLVFVAGVEEGIIPHRKSMEEGGEEHWEEERRLLYVAMTRARKELHLLRSIYRQSSYGSVNGSGRTVWSRFLSCLYFGQNRIAEQDVSSVKWREIDWNEAKEGSGGKEPAARSSKKHHPLRGESQRPANFATAKTAMSFSTADPSRASNEEVEHPTKKRRGHVTKLTVAERQSAVTRGKQEGIENSHTSRSSKLLSLNTAKKERRGPSLDGWLVCRNATKTIDENIGEAFTSSPAKGQEKVTTGNEDQREIKTTEEVLRRTRTQFIATRDTERAYSKPLNGKQGQKKRLLGSRLCLSKENRPHLGAFKLPRLQKNTEKTIG